MPIVPVAIMGTFDLMPAGSVLAKPGSIELKIMPLIEVTPNSNSDDLAQSVRNHLVAAGLKESELKAS